MVLRMISVSLSVAILTSEKSILKRSVQQVRFNSCCVYKHRLHSGRYKTLTPNQTAQSMTRTCQTATLKTENKEFLSSSCGTGVLSGRPCLSCPAGQGSGVRMVRMSQLSLFPPWNHRAAPGQPSSRTCSPHAELLATSWGLGTFMRSQRQFRLSLTTGSSASQLVSLRMAMACSMMAGSTTSL